MSYSRVSVPDTAPPPRHASLFTRCGASKDMNRIQNLAAKIASQLVERGETVSVAESSTGGLVSASLLAVPGASSYFVGGVVVYTASARNALLGVELSDYPGVRAASEPYALLLARTIRARLGTTWALSETGAAGPTGNRYGDAAGHTCVGVSGKLERAATLETGLADRARNMDLFALRALEELEAALGSA